jgi:hypothetical protein
MSDNDYELIFELKYKEFGGLAKLKELYMQGASNPAIAKHFGMTEQGITYALRRILGHRYVGWPFRKLTKSDAPGKTL